MMNLARLPHVAALCVAAALLASPASASFLMRIPLGFSGSTPSTMVLSSTIVDFGSVAITETATATVTLTNTGSSTSTVDVVEPAAPFSLAHNCPASLASAAVCTLTFTFSPTAGGSAAGSATVVGQQIVLGGYGDVISVASLAAGRLHTMIVKPDGTLWATGNNGSGQLGLGDQTNRLSFTRVTSMGTSVATVAAGATHTMVVKKDGTLWATGYNGFGGLGLGDTTNRTSFTQVTSIGTSASKIAAGASHSLVLKADGTLWAAGYNYQGQLGLGTQTNWKSFVQVASLGTSNAEVEAGDSHTIVVKNDGALWVAGRNDYGQLGLGDTTNRTSFTQATSLVNDVASVTAGDHHTMVLKTDGTLWATGYNNYGQLGLGDATNRISFTPVTSMGAAIGKVTTGAAHTIVAKSDGTLWATGYNQFGQLGLGDTANHSSFAQVSSMGTAAAKVVSGGSHTLVLKSDGTLSATGYNPHGQLGLGDQTNRTSFVPVPVP